MKKLYFYAIGFAILIAFDTLTQVSIKLASVQAGAFVMSVDWLLVVLYNPWLYAAVLGYIGAFFAWMTLLKHAPVGPAFAASHLGLIPVLLISASYFGEKLTTMQLLGAVSIMVGIVFLSLSEAKYPHG
ncbi:EamA family transporter [Methylotenera sp.]|uniref:DMT family transporter n=1 Tax=Methylotenera sp. TaxID=2051956 RepID=UPI00248A6A91|nr:EamA family transporter [Methylotenera sp.]MDI1362175.1 EamA family transporter [Methylotenera sp.]